MNPVPKIKRYESPQYLDFIRHLPCVVCMNTEVDAHHYLTKGSGGSDLDTISLCRTCHTEAHKIGITTFQMTHDISFFEVQRKILKTYIRLLEQHLYGRE